MTPRLAAVFLVLLAALTGLRSPTSLAPMAEAEVTVERAARGAERCRVAGAAVTPSALKAVEVGESRPEQASVRSRGYVIPADEPRPPLGRFKLTAYSGPQLGPGPAVTATGTAARHGRTVAVDPRVIPLGSRIYIEGVGERIAEDVGGGVKGNHIDVYLATVPQAQHFGVRRATVSLIASPVARAERRRAR